MTEQENMSQCVLFLVYWLHIRHLVKSGKCHNCSYVIDVSAPCERCRLLQIGEVYNFHLFFQHQVDVVVCL